MSTTTTPSVSRKRTIGKTRTAPIALGTVIDAIVLGVLVLIGIAGLQPAFGDYRFLVPALGGVVIGSGVALLGSWLRWSVLTTTLTVLAAYFVFGTALTVPAQGIFAVIPSLDSLTSLVFGAVFGWADAVTLHVPLEAPPYLMVVPYVAGLVVSFVGVSLAARWLVRRRTPLRAAVLLIGPLVILVVGVLLGTREPFAVPRVVVFVIIALAWVGQRRTTAMDDSVAVQRSRRLRRIGGVAIIAVGTLLAGTLAGFALAPNTDNRFVLRQELQPPFDPFEQPAPLAGFRNYTKDLEKTKLFTVSGLAEEQVIRLASMDTYDGVVWRVSGAEQGTSGSGSFELLGPTVPLPKLFRAGAQSTVTVSVEGYSDVWLPLVGYPQKLNFTNVTGADDPTETIRVNTTTGTAALTSGVGEGLTYQMRVTAPKVPSDKALKNVAPARVTMPAITTIPDVVAAKAEEYAGGSTSAIQQLRNIERSLKELGYMSHGRATDPVPSRAGEGADRMTDLFAQEPMVGDQEQYASAFALMAAHLGYPVRVVMGFAPKVKKGVSTTPVTGDDVTAWAEVAFEDVGWVPFFPTPDKTDAPQERTTKPKLEPQPQVRQPPESSPKDEEVLTPVETKDKNPDEKKKDFVIPAWVFYTAVGVGIPLLLYGLALLIVLLIKRARRQRRRSAAFGHVRVAGAWDELVDTFAEFGFEPPERATRSVMARELARQASEQGVYNDSGELVALAETADRAVFEGVDVSHESAAEEWTRVDTVLAAVHKRIGWLRRRLAQLRVHRRREGASRKRSRERQRPLVRKSQASASHAST